MKILIRFLAIIIAGLVGGTIVFFAPFPFSDLVFSNFYLSWGWILGIPLGIIVGALLLNAKIYHLLNRFLPILKSQMEKPVEGFKSHPSEALSASITLVGVFGSGFLGGVLFSVITQLLLWTPFVAAFVKPLFKNDSSGVGGLSFYWGISALGFCLGAVIGISAFLKFHNLINSKNLK